MKKDRDIQQVNCCRCYWNDQCCSGCGVEQEDCDDFTPLFSDGVEELDYIKQEYLRDLEGINTEENDNTQTWSDSITEAWLRGEDISGKGWW